MPRPARPAPTRATPPTRTLDSADWRLAITKSGYGDCLLRLGRYLDAETMLLEAHHVFAETRGPVDDSTLRAKQRLVRLYQAWSRPGRAAVYQAALEAARASGAAESSWPEAEED